MPVRIPGYRSIPEPWRGRIGLRRARRWGQAIFLERSHNARQPPDAPTINFYPMRPGPNASLAHVMARFPVRIGHAPREDQPTIAWDTGTWFQRGAAERLPRQALNRHCLDISKSTVDGAWAKAAGYSIGVDPTTTSGRFVEKPEINALKGATIVDGPLRRPRRGMVYQLLLDGRADEKRILHLRAVIIDSRIVLMYAKWRPYPQWFRGTERTDPSSVEEWLSAEEAATLLRFAADIGMEYGEVDIVRDRESGRIYAVDANRNPVRPKGLPFTQAAEDAAFGPQVEAIQAFIRDWPTRRARNS